MNKCATAKSGITANSGQVKTDEANLRKVSSEDYEQLSRTLIHISITTERKMIYGGYNFLHFT